MANGRACKLRARNNRKLIDHTLYMGRLKLCGGYIWPASQIAVVLMTRMKGRLADLGFVDQPVVRCSAENLRRGAVLGVFTSATMKGHV